MSHADLEARKNKYFYMHDGLKSIRPELQDEWIEYVDNHTNDKIDSYIIEISIICLKKLMNDISCEAITKTFFELNVSDEIINQVVSIIVKFSPRGEEFKNYWNDITPERKIVDINNSCRQI